MHDLNVNDYGILWFFLDPSAPISQGNEHARRSDVCLRPSSKQVVQQEFCYICKRGGNLLQCKHCTISAHSTCLQFAKAKIICGNWTCNFCLFPPRQSQCNCRSNAGAGGRDLSANKKVSPASRACEVNVALEESSSEASEYEKRRQANIARNKNLLVKLGI